MNIFSGSGLVRAFIASTREAAGRAATGLIAVMLLYNAGVIAVLVLAWANQGLSGIALWPVVLAHTVLAVWCAIALSAREQQ